MTKFLMLIIFLVVSAGSGFCGEIYDNGTRAQIIDVIPDAKPVGMGGAFTSVADDASVIFFNPAGLANLEHIEIPVARNYLFQNIGKEFERTQQAYYGLVYSLQDIHTSNIRNLGTIAVTFNSIDDGKLPQRDVNGNFTGKFKAKDRLITVGYGKPIIQFKQSGRIMFGFNAKFYEEEIEDLLVKGEAFDLGMLWQNPDKTVSMGVAVQNIGKRVAYLEEHYYLPFRTSFGISRKMFNKKLMFAIDASKLHTQEYKTNFGAEYWFMDVIAFRIGHSNRLTPDLGLTAGWGIRLKDVDVLFFYAREITIDYSHATHGEFGGDFSLQRLSLNIKLGAY